MLVKVTDYIGITSVYMHWYHTDLSTVFSKLNAGFLANIHVEVVITVI